MKKILICVDCQYDFIEGGNLPVNGAMKAMDFLAGHITQAPTQYDTIICTLDWHPYDHCSFAHNGGTWPPHCIQHTHGAALYQPLVEALPHDRLQLYLKGSDVNRDEYSFLDSKSNKERFKTFLQACDPQQIVVCGIAGDVCVMNTVRGLIDMGLRDRLVILTPATASIDETVTQKFITQNSLIIKD